MLIDYPHQQAKEHDLAIYRQVVPQNHFLVRLLDTIDWDSFLPLLLPLYREDMGRPVEPPLIMLKLEYLRYHHNLSDREVISRAETDLAYREFLQVPLSFRLPHPTSLCRFRGRLGVDGFSKIFDAVVAAAREKGFVKDRLRIKDATHVIGNMAVPTALALVAQTRDKLLESARPFAPEMVEGELANLEQLRKNTESFKPAERLVTRLSQLKEMLIWCDELTPPENAETHRPWQAFLAQRDLAHKILNDKENPSGDRTISTTDPDARCGKHGVFFDGYMVDILVDADSEIVTQINVLGAMGDEATDTLVLIKQEEAAHRNDIAAVSIDGVGFNGPLLRELEDPNGLNIDAYVPVPAEPEKFFGPNDFQENEAGGVTCPAEKLSTQKSHDKQKQTTKHVFPASACSGCPLLAQCMGKAPKGRKGRTVNKSDYKAEHQRARAKAKTSAYKTIRQDHYKVERKLGEIMNRHGGRRARYRGRKKVLIQQLMATLATNVKRIVRLECAQTAANC